MNIQDWIVLALIAVWVVASVVYIIKHRKTGGCGNCKNCQFNEKCDKKITRK